MGDSIGDFGVSSMEKFVHGGNVYDQPPQGGWLDFSANINPLGLAPAVREAIARNIDGVVHYPDPAARELKMALAGHYEVSRENLVLGNGAAELFYLFLQALRPRSVLIPVPSFSEYERAALASGAEVEYLLLDMASGLELDMKELAEKAVELGTEAVIIGNPNNPTGQLLTTEEISSFLQAVEQLDNPPWLLVDESFLDFCNDGGKYRARHLLEHHERLFIIQSLTKFYALPGLRLGFGIGRSELIHRLELGKDVWNVNLLAQKAGVAALGQVEYAQQTVDLVSGEKDFLFGELAKLEKLEPYPPTVNFILLRLLDMTASQFAAALRQEGILVRNCDNYPGLDEYHVRVAVKSREDNQRLLEAIVKVCS